MTGRGKVVSLAATAVAAVAAYSLLVPSGEQTDARMKAERYERQEAAAVRCIETLGEDASIRVVNDCMKDELAP